MSRACILLGNKILFPKSSNALALEEQILFFKKKYKIYKKSLSFWIDWV